MHKIYQNITKSYEIFRLVEARHMARLKGLFGARLGGGTEVWVGTQPGPNPERKGTNVGKPCKGNN